MTGKGWMTVRSWRNVRKADAFRRERGEAPETGAPRNLHVLVRGRVKLPPGRWTLRLSADDCYQAWLNGKWLGQGPAPAYPDSYYYQEYPVEGGRIVTVALHLYYQGLADGVWNSGDGRFALWAEFVRGDRVAARCDESWRYQVCRAYSGGAVGHDTQFLESFDSRRWPEGWEQPWFRAKGWARLAPAPWADYRLSPQPTANLQRSRVDPAERRPVPGGVLLDFGRERTGTLWAAARGRAGQKLTLRCGEELDGAGRVRYDSRYEEVWTLREGESVLRQYDYKAFHYVEVLGLEDGAELSRCWMWERHYPMDGGLCTLSCGADQLEDIFRICKNAVRCGSQESYLTRPGRGKERFLGDMVVTARAQVWLTGKTDLLRKCVRDLMASARAASFGPPARESAGCSLLFPALPLTDYDFTGDREFLWECWPAVEEIAGYFARYQRPDGLLEHMDLGCGPADGTEDGGGTGCRSVVNALWFGFLLMKEKLERLLNLPRTHQSQRVGTAFLQTFWRWEQKLFADGEGSARCSLRANLYPACFGLTPAVGQDAYERLMLAPGQPCGPQSMYFALRGLGRMGRYKALHRLLTRDDEYGWRNMLREGATACFEAWGKDQKEDISLCCPGAAGAVPLIIEELAGVKPDPDWPSGFRFQPRLPWQWNDFSIQVPLRGDLVQVKQQEWRAALTVKPLKKGGGGATAGCAAESESNS